MAKLIPLLVLIFAALLGVGAGKFLQQEPEVPAEEVAGNSPLEVSDDQPKEQSPKPGETGKAMDYVKLNNQFVIPIVNDERVASLVVMSLSVEVPEGKKEDVLRREPKLRDSFLQVMFNHANIGGFEGEFTAANKLNGLRNGLREIAQRDIGEDIVRDVLIVEIARQDY